MEASRGPSCLTATALPHKTGPLGEAMKMGWLATCQHLAPGPIGRCIALSKINRASRIHKKNV